MTHIHITNADNTLQPVPNKYYIEIEATKLEFDDQIVMQNTLEYPKEQSDQTAASDTYFIDLQKRAHIVNITGRIDKYANRDSNWSALVVQDVSVVRKRLQYMLDRGGTHKLYIGLNDGYYNRANTATENEVYDVAILESGEWVAEDPVRIGMKIISSGRANRLVVVYHKENKMILGRPASRLKL